MGNNIIKNIVENIGSHGSETAACFKHNTDTRWQSYSWDELSGLVRKTSAALLAPGLEKHENIAIFSQNKVEWSIADLGIMGTGAVTVPIYATNTAPQAKYIIDEAEIRFVFVGDDEFDECWIMDVFSPPRADLMAPTSISTSNTNITEKGDA